MYFYKFSLDDSYLRKYARWLHALLHYNSVDFLERTTHNFISFKYHDKENKHFIYGMYDEDTDKVISYCVLGKFYRWKAKETRMLFVDPDYRKLGLALELYDIMLKDGNLILSGYSHNIKSKKLWFKLLKNEKYTSYAVDIMNHHRTAQIVVEGKDYFCELKLYNSIEKKRKKKTEDIRVLLFNPRFCKG